VDLPIIPQGPPADQMCNLFPLERNAAAESPPGRQVARRYIHLDLKGAPPRPSYLIQLFTFVAEWGASGLLIEWEDMVPFTGRLEVVRSPTCYSRDEVEAILAAAHSAGLDVIPLVQTFGHLEFVLKHQSFARYRERKDEVLCLCPLEEGSIELAKELIQQTRSMHPDATYIHIGCDEVFNLGDCARCRAKAEAAGRQALFLDFVEPLVKECAALGVRALLWHDMLECTDADTLKQRLAADADVVVWNYSTVTSVTSEEWMGLSSAFPRVWGASAFKGASEPDAVWPPMKHHMMNHMAWLDRCETTEMHAVILTGWSRFNHTAALCELLPAALPTLAVCLSVLCYGECSESLHRAALERLQLEHLPLDPSGHDFDSWQHQLPTAASTFPGSAVFSAVARLHSCRTLLTKAEELHRVFCPPHTARLSPQSWQQVLNMATLVSERLGVLRPQIYEHMLPVLFEADVDEFVGAKLDPVSQKAGELVQKMTKLLEMHAPKPREKRPPRNSSCSSCLKKLNLDKSPYDQDGDNSNADWSPTSGAGCTECMGKSRGSRAPVLSMSV